MKKQREIRSRPAIPGDTIRITVTFAADQAAQIEALAAEKKVTAAWVIRQAVDAYLANSSGK